MKFFVIAVIMDEVDVLLEENIGDVLKIIVFGATGNTGKCFVNQSLNKGHFITAFARSPSKLKGLQHHERLNIVKGDVGDKELVISSIEGQDVVVSFVGGKLYYGLKAPLGNCFYKQGFVSEFMESLVQGMLKFGVYRIVMQAGGFGNAPNEQPRFFKKWFLRGAIALVAGIRPALLDNDNAVEILNQQNSLDYTVIRAFQIGDFPSQGEVKGTMNEPCNLIS